MSLAPRSHQQILPKILFALLAIVGLSSAKSGCEKSDSITGEEGKLFIRLVQVNEDAGHCHSKVIQAIKDYSVGNIFV